MRREVLLWLKRGRRGGLRKQAVASQQKTNVLHSQLWSSTCAVRPGSLASSTGSRGEVITSVKGVVVGAAPGLRRQPRCLPVLHKLHDCFGIAAIERKHA